MNNKVYDILKWVVITALPASGVFVNAVLPLYGVAANTVNIISGTIYAVTVLLGSLIGVSSVVYNKKKAVEETEEIVEE